MTSEEMAVAFRKASEAATVGAVSVKDIADVFRKMAETIAVLKSKELKSKDA
jgi:hypothetical protein